MNFKTTIPILNFGLEIKHEHKILALGSCFSEYIVDQLQKYKFDCISNTHGILFSPVSIFNALVDILLQKKYVLEDLEQKEDGSFFHFQLHSMFNDKQADRLLNNINQQIEMAYDYLQTGQYLFLTLGSAWTYQHLETARYVANCHEQPDYLFQKILIKPDLLMDTFGNLIEQLHILNKNLKIIFTLSPVRHLKDGFVENQRSKAILLHFIHEMVDRFSFCYYFPAYEILMDDLRDYRFYREDLLHPTEMALKYIWEKFEDNFFSPFTQNILRKIQALHKNLAHRPFEKNDKYYLFLQKSYGTIKSLEMELTFVSFEAEKKFIQDASLNIYPT